MLLIVSLHYWFPSLSPSWGFFNLSQDRLISAIPQLGAADGCRWSRHARVSGKSLPSLPCSASTRRHGLSAMNGCWVLRADVSIAHDPLGCRAFVLTQPVSACVVGSSSKHNRWLFLHDRSEPCLNQLLHSSGEVGGFHPADHAISLIPAEAPGHITLDREDVLHQHRGFFWWSLVECCGFLDE